MKDEKRLYIINTVIYVACVILVYLLIAGIPTSQSNLNGTTQTTEVLGIDLKLLIRAIFSAFGPAFFIIVLINKYVWRYRWFRKIAGIQIPYIHGRWVGYIKSTYTQHKEKHPVVVEFWQTLQYIRVWYYDENAITHSLIADFELATEGGPMSVLCIYRNKPIRTDQKALQQHHGVMEMFVDDETKEIHGIYYNNPHERSTYGEIHLNFSGRKLGKKFKYNKPKYKSLWYRIFT
jgi:hypothetical protein